MEGALGNEALHLSGAMAAFGQRPVRELLDGFLDLAASGALIFVNRHGFPLVLSWSAFGPCRVESCVVFFSANIGKDRRLSSTS